MERIDCLNKLRKKSATCWFLLSKCIMMYGPENVKCVVMSLRFGTKGFNHGHTLSKQMKAVSQVRA
jgi:hypothetical protein